MATADQLLKKMYLWIEQRENCAEQLRKLARELETLRKKCNASDCVSSSVSVGRAACLLGASVATLFNCGAAAPFLRVAGAVYSGAGVTISEMVTKITEHFLSSDTMKEAKRIEEKCKEIEEEIQKLFNELKAEKKKVCPNADADDLDRHVTCELLGAMARRSGLNLHISYSMLDGSFDNAGQKCPFKVMGGAVGLAFALPEAIDSWTDLIKNNRVTEASQSLRDTADTIRETTRTLEENFKEIKETLKKLAEVKRCIENPNRNFEEKQKIIDFVIEMCEDEAVREWLRANAHCLAVFELVNLFNLLKEELDRRLSADQEKIDIIFVAHGGITETLIPAGALVPLSTIEDVLLYSPWNCRINVDIAYGIATGIIQPQHRTFVCAGGDCRVPDIFHCPTNLPNYWNSMRASRGYPIPLINVSPVSKEEPVWKWFEFLGGMNAGNNRIVIPFLLPGAPGPWPIPFFVITSVLSVVLCFTNYKATVHLAACLGKKPEDMLDENYLKQQYSCTIDKTRMKPSGDMLINRHPDLYRALRAVFSE